MRTGFVCIYVLLLNLTLDYVCCTADTGTIQISRSEFERLKDAVSDLQQFAVDQTALNKQLLNANQEIKEENLKLKAENLQRKKENENLVAGNEKLKADNLVLKANHQEMKAELNKFHLELNNQRTLIHDVLSSISEKGQERKLYERKTQSQNQAFLSAGTKTKSVLRKRHTESTVAFFARMKQPYEDHLGMKQKFIFEDVVTNYGNAYNNQTGDFIVPVNGLYCFTSSILSFMDMEFWAAITVNGRELVRFDGRGTGGRHGSGAQTAIVALNKGDEVSVRSMHPDTTVYGNMYTTYGGFLIEEFETDPSTIIG